MLLLRKILYCLVPIAILMTAGITEVCATQEYDANALTVSSESDVYLYSSSGSFYVAQTGKDSNPGTIEQPWRTIQHAADSLTPGDTVFVMAGTYNEKIIVNVSGSESGGYITFKNYNNDVVILDGTDVSGENMIYMQDKDYINISGFSICNNTGVSDGSGIRIEGSGQHIALRDNIIYDITGTNAMGITAYAHSSGKIQYLKIDGNEIFDCEPAPSEALVVNGAVEEFEITNNVVHDVNNIGIDVIGGEITAKVAKSGLVKANEVYRARSSYGGGYGAGIYVDGGVNITVEENIVYDCDLGIEIGCENAGYVVTGCLIRGNQLYNNDKAGLVFGGYDPTAGRVKNCTFANNILYKNQVTQDGEGELWIQYATENKIRNNIIFTGPQAILLSSWAGNENNTLDYNCWFSETNYSFIWNGNQYNSFNAYQSATGQDTNSIQENPRFAYPANADFHLRSLFGRCNGSAWIYDTVTSPCIDAGDPADEFYNEPPPNGDRINIGAYGNSIEASKKGYCVDRNHPQANDSNVGTVDLPWQTIQKAADTMVAGDRVYIRNGTYNEQVLSVRDGNVSYGHIIFAAYPGETPVIDGTGVITGSTGFQVSHSYIKLIGLEICNWNTGIWMTGAGHIAISDCDVHHNFYGIGAADGAHDFVLDHVDIHHFELYGFDASPSGGADCYNGSFNNCTAHTGLDPEQNVDGFALGHGSQHDFIFNCCSVYNVYDGFDISARNTTLSRCSAHDCWYDGYKIWQDDVKLVNCLSYHNNISNLGLCWDTEPGTVTVQNCDFVDAPVYNIWIENAADRLHLYNCILAGGDNIGLAFEQLGVGNYKGNYNIYHNDNPDRAIAVAYTAEFSLDAIAAGEWTNYSGQDQNSLVCYNPNTELFENISTCDFHLVSGSIAIDAGTSEDAPSVDYDGLNRPQGAGYDIGAFEYETSPCFIATAAYGSALHEDIDLLRAFRDEYLMQNPTGRRFVKLYYNTSPPLADAIRGNEWLRTAVRAGLVKPLVHITEMFVG